MGDTDIYGVDADTGQIVKVDTDTNLETNTGYEVVYKDFFSYF